MYTVAMPRPKPVEAKVNANVRVSGVLRDKFAYACAHQLTDATKQITSFMAQYVAAYEAQHGPIALP